MAAHASNDSIRDTLLNRGHASGEWAAATGDQAELLGPDCFYVITRASADIDGQDATTASRAAATEADTLRIVRETLSAISHEWSLRSRAAEDASAKSRMLAFADRAASLRAQYETTGAFRTLPVKHPLDCPGDYVHVIGRSDVTMTAQVAAAGAFFAGEITPRETASGDPYADAYARDYNAMLERMTADGVTAP